jgi:alcohol dehydrogenase class IV
MNRWKLLRLSCVTVKNSSMKILPENMLLPQQTITGTGTITGLPEACTLFGSRGVLVYGSALEKTGQLDDISDRIEAGASLYPWRHTGGEPTLSQLNELLTAIRPYAPNWIAAVGGGSILDLAKAAAGLLTAPLPVVEYHNGAPVDPSHIPFIAVPTTAGTGSEATQVTVLTNEDTGVKKSIRHSSFLPRLVILDDRLLASCPQNVIAASGMDALTQAIESYISRKAHWFSEQLSLKAIELISGSLEAVYADPSAGNAATLLQGSYLAGIALGNARLGLVHGLAHPLGARYHLPHGLVCAVCLPHVIEFNLSAISEKYAEMSRIVNNDLLDEIIRLLQVFKLADALKGCELTDRDAVISETLASGSTAANPRDVTEGDVNIILNKLFRNGEV